MLVIGTILVYVKYEMFVIIAGFAIFQNHTPEFSVMPVMPLLGLLLTVLVSLYLISTVFELKTDIFTISFEC